MKLIVIGGTGLIGSQVVQKLTAAGHQAASSGEPYTSACGRLQRVVHSATPAGDPRPGSIIWAHGTHRLAA